MLNSDINTVKRFIFFILYSFILFSNIVYPQIHNLKEGQSLYSAQVLDKDNYALIIKSYKSTYQGSAYYYSVYHNDKELSTYKEIEYYLLNSNNTVTTLAKQNYIDNDVWSIKNSSTTNVLLYDKIEYMDYSSSSNRALAFMRRDDIGYVVDINGSSITEVGTYSSFWTSDISDDGSRYVFVIERNGIDYIVDNGVEKPVNNMPDENVEDVAEEEQDVDNVIENTIIVDIVLSKDGSRLVYKKRINDEYFLVDGLSTLGPYKEVSNVTLSDNNKYLAYSFKKMPIIEIIEEYIDVEKSITNTVVITNYNTNSNLGITENPTNNYTNINTNNNYTNNINTNSNNINTNNITIITNIIGRTTNYINYIANDDENNSNNNIEEEYYTLSYVSNFNISEYAMVAVDSTNVLGSNIIINDTYNFALYDNVTNATVVTNTQISVSNIIEIITKEIIIEDFNENLVFDNNIIATYDEIMKIDFSPNSESLFYIFKKDNLYYMVIGGDETEGYTNISTYRFSGDDKVFTYNADKEIVVNSTVRENDVEINGIYYLNDNSILYEEKIRGGYLLKSNNYESPIYDDILSIAFDKVNNTYMFYAKRGNKYYYVDESRVEYGPYYYISPIKNMGDNLFSSIVSDGKGIFLINY